MLCSWTAMRSLSLMERCWVSVSWCDRVTFSSFRCSTTPIWVICPAWERKKNNKSVPSCLSNFPLCYKNQPININLTCMLAISLCSRTLASCAWASCCWYHCLTCWSESISAWDVFNRFCRVLRSSWTCWSWLWRPPICWRKSWTAKVTKISHLIKSENKKKIVQPHIRWLNKS